MSFSTQELIERLNTPQSDVEFKDVISHIDENYQYVPTYFTNGDVTNEAGTNEGSCKIIAFAQLNGLSQQATLNCFGHYYHQDVVLHPNNSDHANIRNFMNTGWSGVIFNGVALVKK